MNQIPSEPSASTDINPAAVPTPALLAPAATASLALLLAINLFNYVDRQVLAALEPEIRRSLFGNVEAASATSASLALLLCENSLNFGGCRVLAALEPEIHRSLLGNVDGDFTKFWMGWLSTAFLVSYMVFAPIFSALADRVSRWWLVGVGVLVWSLASGGSGIPWAASAALAYWLLLITRCFVGIGEGGYGPVAPAMLADLYPENQRGRVMSWFYLAIPVGGALGFAFGEIVKASLGHALDEAFGTDFEWRWAFFLVVPPGLLLGAWCFFMKDPPKGQCDPAAKPPSDKSLVQRYVDLLKIPSFVINTAGMTAMTFSLGGLAFWMPDYLDYRNAPGFGPLGPRTVFGLLTAVAGLIGTIVGGWLGDKLTPRHSGAYFTVSGVAMVAGAPALLGFLFLPFPWAWLPGFIAVFCLFVNTGPTNSILANVVHPAHRPTAFALNILIIRILGDAISPPILGLVQGKTGRDVAFAVVAVVMAIGGGIWIAGTKFLRKDTDLAPTRE